MSHVEKEFGFRTVESMELVVEPLLCVDKSPEIVEFREACRSRFLQEHRRATHTLARSAVETDSCRRTQPAAAGNWLQVDILDKVTNYSRRIAAVGFGTRNSTLSDMPEKRVEPLLFDSGCSRGLFPSLLTGVIPVELKAVRNSGRRHRVLLPEM